MMNLPAPSLDRDAFDNIAQDLSQEEAERIAEAFPDIFKAAFMYGEKPVERAPEPRRKASASRKAPAGEPEHKPMRYTQETVEGAVRSFVAANPNERGETIATRLAMDGRAVKRALDKFVSRGEMYRDGARRGARYKLAPAKAPTAEAAE